MKPLLALVVSAVAIASLAGCSGGSEPRDSAPATTQATSARPSTTVAKPSTAAPATTVAAPPTTQAPPTTVAPPPPVSTLPQIPPPTVPAELPTTKAPIASAPPPETMTKQPVPAPADGQKFANCAELNAVYPHGVGLPGAVDKVAKGKTPVTNFLVDAAIYGANTARDGDKDGIACEA